MTGNEIIVLTVEAGAAAPDYTPRTGIAIGVALFVAVVLLVRQRTRTPDLRLASRRRRIVETAAIWAVAYTAMHAPAMVAHADGLFGPSPLIALPGSAGLFMLLALVLVGTADLLLDGLGPRRTLAWLLAGPSLLIVFAIGLLGMSGWLGVITEDSGWRQLLMSAGLLIAGLIWWSRLPRGKSQAAEIFD